MTAMSSSAFSEAFRRPLRILSRLSRGSGSTTMWDRPIADPEAGRLANPINWAAPTSWDVVGVSNSNRAGLYVPTPQELAVPMAVQLPALHTNAKTVDPASFPIPRAFTAAIARSRDSGQSTEPGTVAGRSSLGGNSLFCICDLLGTVAEGAPLEQESARLSTDSTYQGQHTECRSCRRALGLSPISRGTGVGGTSRRSSQHASRSGRPRKHDSRRDRAIIAGRYYQE